jgi:hypothetical protein
MFSVNWSVGLRRWRAAPAALVLCVLAMFVGTSVRAAPPPAGTVIQGTATASYVPAGFTQTETVSSNTVFAVVLPVEALVLTQDQSVARPPGTVVTLSHLLTNTGNVASSYTLSFVNNGAGCAADTLDLSALRIVRDSNNNGVVDANDPALGSGVAGTLSLQPGETASLLVQGTIPDAPNGSACLTLSATTALQGLVAVNHDTVTIVGTAVISLIKSASYPGSVVPGQTRIDFSVAGTNIGVLSAQPSNVAAGSTPVLVNGTPTALILLHDLIPAGTQYIPATLRTAAANSVKLFRLPSDPPFSYRTTEDASAIEVAIGV